MDEGAFASGFLPDEPHLGQNCKDANAPPCGRGRFSGGGDAQQSAQPHGEGRGEDEGHDAGRTPERKASTPAYLSRSWMRAAMSRMMKKDGRTTPSVAQSAPAPRPATHR